MATEINQSNGKFKKNSILNFLIETYVNFLNCYECELYRP